MNNEKTRLVGDKVDKSTWRSVLWRSEEKNTPYLVFDRFGVTTATRVYMRIAFPLLKDGDQKWIKNMCDEINTVTRNLKIRNENTVESMIIYEDGYIGLKDLTTSSPPKYGIYAK